MKQLNSKRQGEEQQKRDIYLLYLLHKRILQKCKKRFKLKWRGELEEI